MCKRSARKPLLASLPIRFQAERAGLIIERKFSCVHCTIALYKQNQWGGGPLAGLMHGSEGPRARTGLSG
jgi:hypothetical protein